MSTTKVAITLDEEILNRLDRLVKDPVTGKETLQPKTIKTRLGDEYTYKELYDQLRDRSTMFSSGVLSEAEIGNAARYFMSNPIGETIKAFVVLKKEWLDGKISEREIIEWAKEHLAGYKYPRQVEFIKSLQRTTIGKIYRKKLREIELKKYILRELNRML